MLETDFESRIKIQDIIERQLPEFILNENPKFLDFLKQYYVSQEYQGGSIDIVENLDQYLKLDNLIPEVIVGNTTLTDEVDVSQTIIYVLTTKGFPEKYGLIKIDDEIITYTGKTSNSFTGCVRGFSGITNYHQELNSGELVFSTSKAKKHNELSIVNNLSSLFLQEFYKKLKYSLTPGLENYNFTDKLNVGNFIKEAKTLYETKGTEESFRILFNILFGETPKLIDIKKLLIKPSTAEYTRRKNIVIEVFSGDPLKLAGQTIFKNNDISTSAAVSEVSLVTQKNKIYYKLSLFIGYDDELSTITGTFNITGNSKCVEYVSVGSSVITVDSTIGFNNSGAIYSNNNKITYKNKSINQFFGCSGISTDIQISSTLYSDETYYGYEDGDVTKKVEFRITGVLSDFNYKFKNSTSSVDEEITIKSIGEIIENPPISKSTYKQKFANSWIYNTSSRYQIDTLDSSTQFTLKSKIDKSSLKIGDKIDILERNTQTIVKSNVTVVNIIEKQIEIDSSFSGLNKNYDIRRKLNKSNSSSIPLEFNSICSDVQNVYNENDEYMYVASNSLPAYNINKGIFSYNASAVSDLNQETGLYSTITFSESISFITGNEIYYKPSQNPIQGLKEGVYYALVTSTNKIKLYSSKNVIGTTNYLFFGKLEDGIHTFILNNQSSKIISAQNLLRKFSLNFNNKSSLTLPGSVGMLINGVEISNYKSENKLYHGPLTSVKVLNGGNGYDVINSPKLSVSYGDALIEPIISGSIKKIYVDPQDFNIDVLISTKITGGNGKGAILEPIIEKNRRELKFDSRLTILGGGVNQLTDTITFLNNHNLIDGEEIIYRSKNNSELGIGTFLGLNTNTGQTLKNNASYYAKIINEKAIRIYQSLSDYRLGINTVGFTTIGTLGIHEFVTKPKNTLSQIKVINEGSGYTNRKLRVKSTGISTAYNTISFPNHGFNDGELVVYTNEGINTNISIPISGLSTEKQYYILKIDDNTFKLSDAGIDGSVLTDYTRRKNVSLGTTGTGYHIFNYPPIILDVTYSAVGLGSTQIAGKISATPIVRGTIIDTYLYNFGADYGSNILNYHKKPIINVENGRNAQFKPIIIDGKIQDVIIQYSGDDYYSIPDINVIGDGFGANLRPVVENNKIIDLIVINSGYGYSEENTTIVVESSGKYAIFDPEVRQLTQNDVKFYGSEIIKNSYNNLQYTICSYSKKIQDHFNDSILKHSPIIGWAYDGNPIYGSYGYSNPNEESTIKRLVSGYELKQNLIENRPSYSEFPNGFFVEDYIFTNSGDLDIHNGRYCITPEFPNGVYAYFATSIEDEQGNILDSFPYFIGNEYRSEYLVENKTLSQSFDFNNTKLIRNTFPYKLNDEYAGNDFIIESNEILTQYAAVDSVSNGVIDNFSIINSGYDYKIGDKLEFDEDKTEGFGLSAQVSEIKGKDILDIKTSNISYNNAIISWNNGNEIQVTIIPKHNLKNLDYVSISGFSTSLSKLNGFYQVEVTSYTSTLLNEIPSSGIVTDIYVSNIPNNISIGSSIRIENETLSILNIFKKQNVLRVIRGNVGTFHSDNLTVHFESNSFKINKSIEYFDSKDTDIIYFNPKYSVGVGTISGIDISVMNNIGIQTNNFISVPTQSIYLPDHPFQTNQKIILKVPDSLSTISVANTSSSAAFSIPFSGNEQIVYVIKKSQNHIGIVTQIGLTTTSNGLFFLDNGIDNYQYSFESIFNQIRGNVEKNEVVVSLSTAHSLKVDDTIKLNVNPNLSVGIGSSTSVKIVRDQETGFILANPIKFNSIGINTSTNEININSHGLKTGDKIKYYSNLVATGLSTGFYYVYKIDNNNIQLSETYLDSSLNPPKTIDIVDTGGLEHFVYLVNPSLNSVKNNNLVFDLSDSSLIGYEFKIFYDSELKEEFISTGSTNQFSISQIGTIGISPNASLTINYNHNIPSSLFYGLEKTGIVSTPDKEVKYYSQINFINSQYNGTYKIIGIGTTTFNISILTYPEKDSYTKSECDILEYTTNSISDIGGVSNIKITSLGSNYTSIPIFNRIISSSGYGANIYLKSDKIGKIEKVRIINQGFDYLSDKTVRPQALISKILTITNFSTFKNVFVSYGGKNYITTPNLIIVDKVTGKKINSGLLVANMLKDSIGSVSIIDYPKGLSESGNLIKSINNSNGVKIESIQSSSSGIVTCFLKTPLSGSFTIEPFKIGDEIFVEGIEKDNESGDGFNSSDYQYQFFTVTNYELVVPRKLEFNLSELTANPGVAKTEGSFNPIIINSKNYPKFEIGQALSTFAIGEKIGVKKQNQFVEIDLKILENKKNYIKVFGSYKLQKNDIIKGYQSGSISTIENINESEGEFSVDYGKIERIGWENQIGTLNDDLQVIPDNDYYQNLSYSVKSNQTWNDIVTPVNSLLHASGLKNFADTQIVKNVGVGTTVVEDNTTVLYDIIEQNRVDTINNFDLVSDLDVFENKSKTILFENKKFSDYFECRTNRVLKIDDISSEFSTVNEINTFNLTYDDIPIFVKTFDPSDSSILDLSTGQFKIENHFFSTGEELIYTPNSSVGGSLLPVGIGETLNSQDILIDTLPNTVYAIKDDNSTFRLSTRKDYAYLGIGVTFINVGQGDSHELEMTKKNEKSIISINNIVQSPISYSLLSYNLDNGDQISAASTIFGLSGISSIFLGDLLKIDNEYMKVTNVGLGTTYSGPISFNGNIPLVQVERGFVGTISTSHSNLSNVFIYRGSFNIVKNKIYFTDPPKGGLEYDPDLNLSNFTSYFNGRVFLRKDYTTNEIYDNISENFTGIGQTYTLTVGGANTFGMGSNDANGIVFINGIYQAPSTDNNPANNFNIIDDSISGISSIVFSGISTSGGLYISENDVNMNRLPRGGIIISLGSTPGLGYAPLVGASVTAVVGAGGSIVSIDIGTNGTWGSGYREPVSVAITESGHNGIGATIATNVGAGGTLSFNIVGGGTNYINPTIIIDSPNYSNLPIIGVSRLGIGETTDCGTGLLLNVEIGSSSTTGIGSTLFEVVGFEIARNGYQFKKGDVIKPVGLVTAYALSSPISEFELTILDVFTDSFMAQRFGQLDYIDSIKRYQNGSRTKFPLYYNSSLLSFEKNKSDPDSQLIDFNNLLIIFVNSILQEPGVAYQFNGGTTFNFTEPPKSDDKVDIYFYKGSSEDSVLVNVFETIKIGDNVQIFSNNNILGLTTTQNLRTISDISTIDSVESIPYDKLGIDQINLKPINWTKQKNDLIINGDIIFKDRDSIESQIYPTAKIIKNLSSKDTTIFVDDIQLFNYENEEEPLEFNGLIVDNSIEVVSASVTAIVSSSGTIQSLVINNSGSGYQGSIINVSISNPQPSIVGFGTTLSVGIGTTATATISIINGSLSTVTIINPGSGYTQTNPPQVLIPLPDANYETITNVTGIAGTFGNITGIGTTVGIGTDLAVQFTLSQLFGTGLEVGYPIYIFNTSVGNGVTSIIDNDNIPIGIGTTFLDNIYYVNGLDVNAGIITCNIHSKTLTSGIDTSGFIVGQFSWGKLTGFTRSINPISIGISGYIINSGLTTFPTIQRRKYGLRNNGALKKIL